jgi:5-formyltetrahydrofolate cyclo-ligase
MATPLPQTGDAIAARKAGLRKEMIAARDALGAAERARLTEALFGHLIALPQYRSARSVLATMSIGAEWDTSAFVRAAREAGKWLALPRVTPKPSRLVLHRVDDPARDLVPGVWNIPEPDPARCPVVKLEEVDFALIPALAADREGYRLGYGAGYFDGLLTGRGSKPFCVAALPRQFLFDELPRNARDVPLDLVIDEQRLPHTSRLTPHPRIS